MPSLRRPSACEEGKGDKSEVDRGVHADLCRYVDSRS